MTKVLAVIGGGAAGFFGAIQTAESDTSRTVHIFEKSQHFLSKVKVSGGGRCNVTHACFDPKQLTEFYPRGKKELLGPFYSFQPADTIEWFEQHGVHIIAEDDGRMFPNTHSSKTIIDCFMDAVRVLHVQLHTEKSLEQLQFINTQWHLLFADGTTFMADDVLITTGSSQKIWQLIAATGHTLVPPVPSLFSFKIQDQRISELQGLSFTHVVSWIDGAKTLTEGPMIITHWGLSGPAILKLSSFEARWLAEKKYQFTLHVNFAAGTSTNDCLELLSTMKREHPKKFIHQTHLFQIPSRMIKSICLFADIDEKLNWSDISKEKMLRLSTLITDSRFQVTGKNTFKDEFVTCGGVALPEVNMKTMESRLHPHLYFAGEVLDIDAVTGGFNFQAAWTTAALAASAITAGSRA